MNSKTCSICVCAGWGPESQRAGSSKTTTSPRWNPPNLAIRTLSPTFRVFSMLPLGMLNIWATNPRNRVEIRSAPTRMRAISPTPLKNRRGKERSFSCVTPVPESSVLSNAIAFLRKQAARTAGFHPTGTGQAHALRRAFP